MIVSTENPDKLQITHEYLIPILVNALNELDEEIRVKDEQYNTRLNSAEEKIKQLTMDIEQLKSRFTNM